MRTPLIAAATLAALGAPPAATASAQENPCVQASWRGLRCPDLVMKRPADVKVVREGPWRWLQSQNSIDNIGSGPAELDAFRPGRARRMVARQRIYRRGGGSIVVGGRGRVVWKPIPGQGGYWKWENAARMELWSLDRSGRQVRMVRRSPKLVYCLRDLFRTRPRLRGSPRRAHYPGCNQDPRIRRDVLGTSVGWSDVYPSHYYEQYIDVTGLRGRYALVHVADPENVLYESNETNNAARVIVSLPSGRVVGR
ncbi:MAG: hypothetical protein U0T02_00285 [Solirubrobacteraceae bacterium]